ncbi:TraC family protein [Pseudoalteromonas sp. T1lg23B]|uniref:TraC family protein n=1 Tax=Pseudoalteromonas sp. T1lg23B TaxID=2077097 RepID=UPI000CF638C3|nr:TraC family protein [Pseudoalteromonas sp. T1lg23B]
MSLFSSSAKLAKKLLKRHSPGELFPYVDYLEKDQAFITDDGHLGAIWICSPINGTAKEVESVLNNLLSRKFPDDCWLQCMLFAVPDVTAYLRGYAAMRGGRVADPERNRDYSVGSRVIRDFWEEATRSPIISNGTKARNFRLYFSFKMPVKGNRNGKFATAKEMAEFRRYTQVVEGALKSMHLAPFRMDQEELLYQMQVMFNWNKNAGWRKGRPNVDSSMMLKDQIFDIGGGFSVSDDNRHVLLKDKVITAYSVNTPPAMMMMGRMLNLTGDWQRGIDGIFDNYAICVNVFIPNQKKALNDFSRSRTALKHQSKVGFAAINERIQFQKEDYDLMYERIEKGKQSILEWSMHILHFTDTVGEAKEKQNDLEGYFNKKDFGIVPDEAIMLPLVMSCMPLSPNKETKNFLERTSKDTSEVVALFMPIYASWQGNCYRDGRISPLMTFVTRTGALFGFNPFETDSNMNMLVCATSGAGKSFFTNGFVSNLLTSGSEYRLGLLEDKGIEDTASHPLDGGQVFIIDVGYSYVKLCEIYDGQYLEFNEHFKYSLQPFKTVDEWEGEKGMADMVFQLISLMAFPKTAPDDFQESRMRTLLNEVWWEHGNNSTIDDFQAKCLADQDRRINDVGYQLAGFCKGGMYYRYFDPSKKPVEFNGQLIVVELEQLKSQEHLQKVVLLQMFSNIQFAMYLGDRNIRKALIIDEGWEWIKSGNETVGKFLETGWRRFRKYNSMGCLITQSYLDTMETPVGRALATNSQFKAIMMQGDGEVEKLKSGKHLTISDGEYDLMETVRTEKGKFSEIFLQAGPAREVVRFVVPRFEQLMYSTDPKDVNRINKLKEQGMTTDEAITHIINSEAS